MSRMSRMSRMSLVEWGSWSSRLTFVGGFIEVSSRAYEAIKNGLELSSGITVLGLARPIAGVSRLAMEAHFTEESVWASGLAARLRLIQATFADDAAETRQNYITEEIERALKDVVPSKRP